MNVGKFWLLTFLSLVIAVLIMLEIVCEIQIDRLSHLVSYNESRVSQAQRQGELLHRLIQRMATESQQDPALLNLLTKRGIHLQGPNANGAATPEASPSLSTPPPK